MTKSARIRGDLWPGDGTVEDTIAAMIRVNQAGEYGARRIYAGQLAVLESRPETPPETIAAIREMAAQEQDHLDAFNEMAASRHVRPTALQPFWHVAGFALGAVTAAMGEKAAMACTVAVEEVIDEHYAEQAARLGEDEKDLRDTIEQFRADELEHRDTALAHDAEQAPAYEALTTAIKGASRLAIWLSTRV